MICSAFLINREIITGLDYNSCCHSLEEKNKSESIDQMMFLFSVNEREYSTDDEDRPKRIIDMI